MRKNVSGKREKRQKRRGKALSEASKASGRAWPQSEPARPLTAHGSPFTLPPKHPYHSPTPNRRGR